MIIKTFTAESAAAALKMVRTELGRDAVVLKTRELPLGRGSERIEITACCEKPIAQTQPAPAVKTVSGTRQVVRASFPQVDAPKAEPAKVAASGETSSPDLLSQTFERMVLLEKKLNQVLSHGLPTESEDVQQLRQRLTDADLPANYIEELIAAAKQDKATDVAGTIRTRLTDTLTSSMLPGLSFKPGDRIAFLGYAGAGKTSALGKLAARLVYHEKQTITLVTLDTVKVGAFEELSSYADILGSQAVDYQTAAAQLDESSITLIDTPGLSRQKEQLSKVRDQLQALKPSHTIVVISAMTRSTDVIQIIEQLKSFSPTHLTFTMLDLTERWGSAVAAARLSQLPVAFVTNAPAGMGTVNAPDPAAFTRTILTKEERRG